MGAFRARFGIWHDHTVLFMQDRLFGDYDMVLTAAPEDMRELRVYEGGPCTVQKVMESNLYAYDMWPYYFRSSNMDHTGFCHCGPLDVNLVARRDHWYCELPPNHELPWPHVRDFKSYDTPGELMKECEMRSESARLHGTQMTAPSLHIERALTPAMRVKLFTVVK